MSKKIVHFRTNCIGCSSCVIYAPDNWTIDPADGKATLNRSTQTNDTFVAEIAEPEVEVNLLAAQSCPVGIIHIIDESGKEMN